MQKIGAILEELQYNRNNVTVYEWLMNDLGDKFAIEVRDGKALGIVFVDGSKKSPLQTISFDKQTEVILQKAVDPFLREYYKRYPEVGMTNVNIPMIIAKMREALTKGEGTDRRYYREVMKDCLINIAKVPLANASVFAEKLEDLYKKSFKFEA